MTLRIHNWFYKDIMRNHLLVIILMAFGMFQAFSQSDQSRQLAAERESIIQTMDSLEIRKDQIDHLLSQVNPKDRLEAMTLKYGKNKGKLIASRKVWPTISFEMARDSWGEPDDIKTTTLTTGSTAKWTYSDNRYLFFKNGRLESWRE